MGDGSLSQAEIDALLSGADNMGDSVDMGGGGSDEFTSDDRMFLFNTFSQAMQTASSAASMQVGKNVKLENPFLEQISSEAIPTEIPPDGIVVTISLGTTQSIVVLTLEQGKQISSSIMGSDPEMASLDDGHLSSLAEFINTVIAGVSNYASSKFSDNLAPSAPTIKVYTNPGDLPNFGANVLKVAYQFSLETESLGKFTHYIDMTGPQKWTNQFQATSNQGQQPKAASNQNFSNQTINPVSFPTFQATQLGGGNLPPNYELLLDVQMTLTVELGRTTKYVKDVLSLGEGSIIELDKLAGEPVDLLVNGKLIAKGEVVVIDENFGVRVTDIVGPADRLAGIASSLA